MGREKIKTPFYRNRIWSNKWGELQRSGGADGDRTRYLVVANDALSQMSYSPKR